MGYTLLVYKMNMELDTADTWDCRECAIKNAPKDRPSKLMDGFGRVVWVNKIYKEMKK